MLAVEWPLLRAALDEAPPRAQEGDADASPPPHTPDGARLAAAKARVPAARAACGEARWRALTDTAVPRAPRPAVASRAYHKLREILRTCALPLPRASLHLCEAPGGFVQALADEVADAARRPGAATEWRWVAASLQSAGVPRPAHDLPLAHGAFVCDLPVAGDLLDAACADALVERVGAAAVDLVTADGAAAMDHADVEGAHRALLLAQTRVALRCLREGGCFVIKYFEGAQPATLAWMARLTTRFDRVALVKPTTSRPTNSERYLVARGYRCGSDAPTGWDPTAPRVAEAWLSEARAIADRMAREQTRALERALERARGKG
tara:strand:- start:141 stop:1109 length:969 start_codon:yes stop_codon:yes gene_type:complete